MVTSIRAITQELENFATEYATQIEHQYVDSRSLAEEIATALKNNTAERAKSLEKKLA